MYKFIRWYNQNRMEFFIILIVIAFILIFIQILNGIAEVKQEEKKVNLRNSNISKENTTISKINESVITGEKILDQDNANNINLISQFIEYCNKEEIENAYQMLTDECKELMYPTIREFKNNYYDKIFYIERLYGLENWFVDSSVFTYYIKYTEDIMATGNVSSSDNKADFITVVKTNNEYKLNISSYVGRENVAMSAQKNDIQMKVNWIDKYIDYSIANITILNDTKNMICMDSKKELESVYMYDTDGVKYEALLNELSEEQLIVYRGQIDSINIKFNQRYNPDKEIYGIVFKDVVLNYEKYQKGEENKETIKIEIQG